MAEAPSSPRSSTSQDETPTQPASPGPSSSSSSSSSSTSSSSGIGAKWYLPSTSPVAVVNSFLKHLQPRSLLVSKHKEFILAFAKWYFQRKPTLPFNNIQLLLFGDTDRKGLMETCGNTKLQTNQLRGSSKLALELLLMLIDINVNTQHAESVLDVVVHAASNPPNNPLLSTKLLQSMKFNLHILTTGNNSSDGGNAASQAQEYAFKLIFILEESIPSLKDKKWIGSSEAVSAYESWQKAHLEAAALAEAEAQKDDAEREVTSWAEVKLIDLNAEDAAHDEALAELIADVDAEAAEEAAQRDPLGIIQQKIVLTDKEKHKTFLSSTRIGKAASKRMRLLWKKITTPEQQQQQTQTQGGPTPEVSTRKDKAARSGVKDSSASAPSASGDLMSELLSSGSISTAREDFNPVLFLSAVHSSTSLEQLVKGLAHLQQSVNNRAAQMKLLVAEHFGQYVYCLDTIDHLHELIQSELNEKQSRGLKLQKMQEELSQECSSLYEGIMLNKKDSDRMRDTLTVLGQYRYLFTLPGEIQQHIQQKQFAQIIRDYKKAKAVVITRNTTSTTAATSASPASPNVASTSAAAAAKGKDKQKQTSSESVPPPSSSSSSVPDVPGLVLAEVHRLIGEVRASLFRQLDNPSLPFEDQQRVIAYLLELDCETDPAWYYLQRQREWIGQQMEQGIVEYIERIHGKPIHSFMQSSSNITEKQAASQIKSGQGTQSSAAIGVGMSVDPRLISFGSLLASNPSFSLSTSSSNSQPQPNSILSSFSARLSPSSAYLSESSAHSLHRVIRRLCSVLSKSIPSFIKLSELISSGQFVFVAQQQYGTNSDTGNKDIDGNTSINTFTATDTRIQQMLYSIFRQFSAYIRLLFFPIQQQHSSSNMTQRGITHTESISPPRSPTPHKATTDSAAGGLSSLSSSLSSSSDSFPLSSSVGLSVPPLLPPVHIDYLPFPSSMRDNLYLLLRCFSSMRELQIPPHSLQEFTSLRQILIRWFLEQSVRNASVSIFALIKEEDWATYEQRDATNTAAHKQQQQQQYSRITRLPLRAKEIITETLISFSALPSSKSHWVSKLIAAPMMEVFRTLADAIQTLAIQQQQQQHIDAQELLLMTSISNASSVHTQQRFLLLLSNLRFTHRSILPSLFSKLLSLLPPNHHAAVTAHYTAAVLDTYDTLDTFIFSLYIRHAVFLLHTHIKLSTVCSGIQWQDESIQSSSFSLYLIRPSTIQLMQYLVLLHAQISSIIPELLSAALSALVVGVYEGMLLTIRELECLSAQSCQLLLLEMEWMHELLSVYSSTEAEEILEECSFYLEDRLLVNSEQKRKWNSQTYNKDKDKDKDKQSGTRSSEQLSVFRQERKERLLLVSRSTALMFVCFNPVSSTKIEERKEKSLHDQRSDDEDAQEADDDKEEDDNDNDNE